MDWTKVFTETLYVSYTTITKMIIVIVPLLIAIECLKDMGWLEKLSDRFSGVTRLLRLPGEAALGLIVGLFVGLLFGSGVIMQITEEVKMTRTQINTLFVFIGLCHAIIEETILFTAIGANGVAILLCRILTSLVFGFIYIWISARNSGFDGEQSLSVKSGN